MSRYTECDVTLTIGGDERDCHVRAYMLVEPGLGRGGSWGAEMDGDPDIWVHGSAEEWMPSASFALGDGDSDRIDEALCDRALENAAAAYEEAGDRAYEAMRDLRDR